MDCPQIPNPNMAGARRKNTYYQPIAGIQLSSPKPKDSKPEDEVTELTTRISNELTLQHPKDLNIFDYMANPNKYPLCRKTSTRHTMDNYIYSNPSGCRVVKPFGDKQYGYDQLYYGCMNCEFLYREFMSHRTREQNIDHCKDLKFQLSTQVFTKTKEVVMFEMCKPYQLFDIRKIIDIGHLKQVFILIETFGLSFLEAAICDFLCTSDRYPRELIKCYVFFTTMRNYMKYTNAGEHRYYINHHENPNLSAKLLSKVAELLQTDTESVKLMAMDSQGKCHDPITMKRRLTDYERPLMVLQTKILLKEYIKQNDIPPVPTRRTLPASLCLDNMSLCPHCFIDRPLRTRHAGVYLKCCGSWVHNECWDSYNEYNLCIRCEYQKRKRPVKWLMSHMSDRHARYFTAEGIFDKRVLQEAERYPIRYLDRTGEIRVRPPKPMIQFRPG